MKAVWSYPKQKYVVEFTAEELADIKFALMFTGLERKDIRVVKLHEEFVNLDKAEGVDE